MAKLYLVPTPIGNLEDLTFRAKRILGEVDLILAEDTRKSGILLKEYGIHTSMTPYHQHNEHRVLGRMMQMLLDDRELALVTDAGTPGISDPGYLLLRECIRENIPVESLPGPSAFLPALVQSGLPCDRFFFEGFLPPKKGRRKRLSELSLLKHTIILYESPHRLLKTLEQLAAHFGPGRQASVSRELTKIHEETVRGNLEEITGHFLSRGVKGECVIIISGND
ncbi:MAG: 16S rRNA (cytidine(1402)-2'-O)-methyltransferase [Bacteroidales bacterium]